MSPVGQQGLGFFAGGVLIVEDRVGQIGGSHGGFPF
jgi:hypothetical protein